MRTYLICPTCGSDDIVKNGLTRRARQNHKCRDCGRQFVEDAQWKPSDRPTDPSTFKLIDLMLLERIPLAGISRVLSIVPVLLLDNVPRRRFHYVIFVCQ